MMVIQRNIGHLLRQLSTEIEQHRIATCWQLKMRLKVFLLETYAITDDDSVCLSSHLNREFGENEMRVKSKKRKRTQESPSTQSNPKRLRGNEASHSPESQQQAAMLQHPSKVSCVTE